MDKTGFKLGTARKSRCVGPTNASSSKLRAALSNAVHSSVVANISTTDAPVPLSVIYPGVYLLEEWFGKVLPEPMAMVTASGYTNNNVALEWLSRCFKPSTRARAKGSRRLLFLDGHKSHVQVKFLEACWDANIDVVCLPASMSSIFQPLDVNFFNELQKFYEDQVFKYQLGSTVGGALKGMFYSWLQKAWTLAATGRQIWAAWRDSGLWPLGKTCVDGQATPPPPSLLPPDLNTPRTLQTLQTIDRAV